MKWARFINGAVQEIVTSDPNELFHPEVAKLFVEVDDSISMPIVEIEPTYFESERVWTIDNLRSAMTLSERVKWDNESVDVIKTAKIEFQTPQFVDRTTEILQFLVDSSALSQQTMENILS